MKSLKTFITVTLVYLKMAFLFYRNEYNGQVVSKITDSAAIFSINVCSIVKMLDVKNIFLLLHLFSRALFIEIVSQKIYY